MTNRNLNWNPDGEQLQSQNAPRNFAAEQSRANPASCGPAAEPLQTGNVPFLLSPVGKEFLWGGTRLNDDFSKGIDLNPLAESWECSTHPDGPSLVASGEFQGQTLADVLKAHPEYLGTHPAATWGNRSEKDDDRDAEEQPDAHPAAGEIRSEKNADRDAEKHAAPSPAAGGLPILIKLIDARKDLSVQVHPDDAYAREFENGSLGKTEMWYVLDATKDAKLIYGFYHDTDEATIRRSLADGTVEKYLRKVPVKKGDVFFIPAGTVHAIGAGALIAEIQESSNLTYRLYDYNRTDKNGNQRELHIDKALQVANLKGSAEPKQPMRVLKFRPGVAGELLCRCKYFEVSHVLLNTERVRQMVETQAGANSFVVLLCTEGCGIFAWEDTCLPFYKGDCLFIPANSVPIRIHGKAQMLKVSC